MAEVPKTYLVECFLPGVDDPAVQEAADAIADELWRSGRPVAEIEYLGALLMAVDEVVLHAFRASDPELVSRVGTAAGISFSRIVESVEVLPVPLIRPVAASSPKRPVAVLHQPREVPL